MELDHPGRIVFIGAVHEAEPALRVLVKSPARIVQVVTLAEPVASRTAGFVDLGPLAAVDGAPVLRTTQVNAPGVVARIAAQRPDLIVCVGWTRLLGDVLLRLPRYGCVGFHSSLLPQHRGRAPVNWAIIRGDPTTGNTMMMLDPGADTGDIVDQERISIAFSDTCATVYAKVGAAGARMLQRHLPALLQGTAPRRSQPRDDLAALPKRTPEMGITAWSFSPVEVYNWIRALTHPYPGAFGLVAGRRLRLWRADDPADGDIGAPPGTLVGIDGSGVRIAVRGGSVRLLLVQEDGADEESAAQWYQRSAISSGACFDPVDDETIDWARGLRVPSASDAPMAVSR